ncbi:MAG: metal ABC transporter permease, partial [Candidatus Thiodiazotropha sp. (ex Lucinoma borealis)]|nr:metal ABC transporter permease [Candidatus Thiodiazotropha sp. (ex Lucinoma borealis)]
VVPVAVLYLVVLGLWSAFRHKRSSLLFYLLFAVAITASVQLVGVYLVFATLILPALSLRHLDKAANGVGYLITIIGYGLGLFVAALLDLPAGAVIVYTLAISSLLMSWVIRQRHA